MEFIIKNINSSINDIMRQIGYAPSYFQKANEFSIVRKVTRNDYPRFHLYIKEKFFVALAPQDKLNTFVFNLHLDQKKPSYKGSHAHSGEYDGDMVESEAKRIKDLLK
ncbi:MAG: hypothetical protein HY005_02590 [Candidatus Staskawiczbacteria bacterium]|nr:hypothetical protein [Candidatus Staskawiczbacteria bacterium]